MPVNRPTDDVPRDLDPPLADSPVFGNDQPSADVVAGRAYTRPDKMPAPPSAALRRAVLLGALAFTLVFAAMTVFVVIEQGFDIFVLAALVILAMFAFGLFGALRYRGEDPVPPQ